MVEESPNPIRTIRERNSVRWLRFLGSFVILMLPVVGIMLGLRERDVSYVWPLTLYASFVFLVALILAMIAGRLYRQHEVMKFRVDVATMILVTSLIALPLGFADVFVTFLDGLPRDISRPAARNSFPYLAFLLYFQVAPTFFVTEFLIDQWLKARR